MWPLHKIQGVLFGNLRLYLYIQVYITHDIISHITLQVTEDYLKHLSTISPKEDTKVDIILTSGQDVIRYLICSIVEINIK